MNVRLLVWQLGIEDVLVGLGYVYLRDWPRAAYWLAAGISTAMTLWIGGR